MDAGRDLNEFFQFSRALVQQRKEQPGDDYPSKLLEIRGGNDEVLTENEIICLVFGIMLAGHEAVTAAMGNIFHALLEQPGNWARLVDNPALIPSAVEEGLRFNSGMFNWRRRATEDVVLGGVTVPKDAKILVSLGSANRDDRHFADPTPLILPAPMCVNIWLSAAASTFVSAAAAGAFPDGDPVGSVGARVSSHDADTQPNPELDQNDLSAWSDHAAGLSEWSCTCLK